MIGRPVLHRAHGMQWVSATVADECGQVRCMWFNQPWMKDKLLDTQRVTLYGCADRKKTGVFVINPTMEQHGIIQPIYAPVPGVGQKLLRDAIRLLLEEYDAEDPLPQRLLERYRLMGRREALIQAHFPNDTAQLARAKNRLSFEELLLYQTAVLDEAGERRHTMPLPVENAWIDTFCGSLPFPLTDAQRRAIGDIVNDLRDVRAMARMVQGDVGCGKTVIAFCAMYLCARAGGQSALMAPTEILAVQHWNSAQEILRPLGVTCGLITGHMTAAEKRRAREAVACGEWQAVVGTHALISEGVEFANLTLAITDEQHRFGVRQRTRLEGMGDSPNVMVMSATPIPRTLSLVLYGDLDISAVDELPPGRKPVHTRIVPEEKRDGMYGFIRDKAAQGQQTYVVCPLIGREDGNSESKSACEVYSELKRSLAPLRVGLVHGRLSGQEKEEVLSRFYAGQLYVLVTKTVIEVGVNVPNATVMVIEGAERFGLAQLHQLRGRVGRGAQESWCFLMAEPNERLRTLVSTNDGFAIAQKDLELRGAGEFFGEKQHGEPRMPAVMLAGDSRLLAQTREALLMLKQDDMWAEEWQRVRKAAKEKYGYIGNAFGRN